MPPGAPAGPRYLEESNARMYQKMMLRNSSPSVNPIPWPKLLETSFSTTIQTMTFTIGIRSRTSHHPALFVIPFWVVFTKAGQPGWAALIPIYNIYIILKIVGRP
jgi:hypothetical protein